VITPVVGRQLGLHCALSLKQADLLLDGPLHVLESKHLALIIDPLRRSDFLGMALVLRLSPRVLALHLPRQAGP
jgi:hypothetical protein